MLTLKVIDGDIPVGAATGRPLTLSGTSKFSQDVEEVLDILADLRGMIGLIGDTFTIRAEVSRRLTTAFASYKAAQDAVQKSTRPVEERFSRTAQVIVLPLRDPTSGTFTATSYAYRVDVLSVKGGTATTVTGVLAR